MATDISSLLDTCSIKRIVLSGSNDIEEPGEDIRLRNDVERQLIELSISKNIPLLGICRGMQFIHHYFGGRLCAISGHVRSSHEIRSFPNALCTTEKTAIINSFHRYGIDEGTLSKELDVFARCKSDGSIEGIFHREYPIYGILWHPERDVVEQDADYNKDLIRHFLS